MSRPSKDNYYLNIAREVAARSTCLRRKQGAIIVKDLAIVATGYNGAPRKTKDCLERGECLREKLKIPHGQRYELSRGVHAEQNAIINAARVGVSILGGDFYIWGQDPEGNTTDSFPCFICKKMIINAGINRVLCSNNEGGKNEFRVEDWIKDWQEKDIIDDEHKYGEY